MKKICVVTTSRAEYGMFRYLLTELQNRVDVELQLVVTGSHLSSHHGHTVDEIEKDGFPIARRLEVLMASDSAHANNMSMSMAQVSFSEAYQQLQPDFVVVMGDRFELVPVVLAANLHKIPVAHLSGGEVTEGALDELFRHAISKLSQLHFTAMEVYRRRLLKMGESPERVFTVGEIGLDALSYMTLMDRDKFEKTIEFNLGQKNLLITFHPETTRCREQQLNDLEELLRAVGSLDECKLIFTASNADEGGEEINRRIKSFCLEDTLNRFYTPSLGHLGYLSALTIVDCVIGNSSSGVVEAPSYKVASINIGNRQKGRERADSVIDVEASMTEICKAIARVYSSEYQAALSTVHNPYGRGDASKTVADILVATDGSSLICKPFYDA